MSITASSVRRTIRQFTDYSQDLLRADMGTFENRLNILAYFCSSDTTFQVIHQQLMKNPAVNLDEWLADKTSRNTGWAGSSPLEFPVNTDERVCLMYQLVFAIHCGKIAFQPFLVSFFSVGTSKINHFINAFQEAVLSPLFRELYYKLEELENRLPEQSTAEISPSSLHILHNSGPIIQQFAQGSHISQNASQQIQNPEIQKLFSELVTLVHSVDLSNEQRRESNEILASVEEELKKPNPKKSVVRAMLHGLPIAASLAEIITAIISLLG